jgi:ketosteroid isomerase-like protein
VGELRGEAREVFQAVLQIAEAFDRRDLGTLLSAHYPGPESSLIPAGVGERATGWEAVRSRLETQLGEFQQSRTEIDRGEVSVFGDIAIVSYEQKIQAILHDIDFSWVGWVTDVLVRRQGRWLRVHHHASDRSQP